MRKDEEGKIVCASAKDYKKNGLVYTFNLRTDITWSNETEVTAHDFVFAFKRAVTPETASPFVNKLLCIKNAKAIINGELDSSHLGVKAIDRHTLRIELSSEDKNFEETLTTSIAMPCNEAFFYSSEGKYGLEKECIISNGSYRLAKWGKEIFGIRLYRNDYYEGNFRAQNAAVFFTLPEEKSTPLNALTEKDADIAFVPTNELSQAKQAGLETEAYNSTCWYLTLSDGFSKDLRKSLISLANSQVFANSLKDGYYPAQSIYPKIINKNIIPDGMPAYDLDNSKKLFTGAVEALKDKKFPTDVVLYYYDDGISKNVVTDIVGHWQNQLGAFVNIEAVSSPDVLTSQLNTQSYALCIFPLTANTPGAAEYLKNFGINYTSGSLENIQTELLSTKNIVPLMTQDTVIAYGEELANVTLDQGNGCIDFAYIVKSN